MSPAEAEDFLNTLIGVHRNFQRSLDRNEARCMKLLKECEKINKDTQDMRQEIDLILANATAQTQKWMQIPVVEDNEQPSIDVIK
jgi:prefoldin subunit 5